MDGGEGRGIAGSREEHRISIPDHHHNAAGGSGSGASVVGPGGITADDQEWIREMEDKIKRAFDPDSTLRPLDFNDETEDKICESTLRESRISQRRSEPEGELSWPSVVTIGPFQRRNWVSIFDYDKWMIVGLMNHLCGLDVVSCLVKIKNQAANARSRYNLDDHRRSYFDRYEKEFAEMLLLDSYFILFTLTIRLRRGPAGYTLTPPTPKFTKEPLKPLQCRPFQALDIVSNKEEIVPDLLILDNQIPFFVIEELFKELNLDKPLFEYALEFFETIHPRSARHCKDKNISPPPKFLHLLHLFHWSRVPQNKYIELTSSSPPQQPDSIGWARHTPNAMELRESATVFEKKTSGSSSLDIAFRRRRFNRIIGVLDIPELHIRNYSSVIFPNLIAFEIQSSSRGRCTVAFSALMRNFLQREEDVKLLRQRGILASSSMTDRQLIDLFARLNKLIENHEMPIDLSNICHQVQSHHNHPVSRFCGRVSLHYFPNPLVTLSVFAATMIFILTLLQTIYAMVYHS